jgi:hypothetical protein
MLRLGVEVFRRLVVLRRLAVLMATAARARESRQDGDPRRREADCDETAPQ